MPVPVNALPGAVEWNAVEFANRVDESPIRSNEMIVERDVIRPRNAPTKVPAASRIKAFPLHQELRQPRDAICDASCFVRREMTVRVPDPL